ncbi:MAG: polysaccharide biosynthesis/export protein [Acidobacteria bacterium]|nr:polysaccharide biosynthesis/export protein [Acidobacteriota bacterium]
MKSPLAATNGLAWPVLLSLLTAAPAPAQTPTTIERPAQQASAPPEVVARDAAGPDFRIGADDELSISVLQAPELNRTTRVSQQGLISLPLLGTVRAAGLTQAELEAALEEELGRRYIKHPEVSVEVSEIRSRPVSVVGAVARPGILQVRGSTTLLDVISMAGGLRDDAGDTVVVTRPGAGGQLESVEVKLKPLIESRDPASNAAVHPGDIVTVRAADVVYVVGAVNKPGAFPMPGNDRVTVLQAVALGQGLVATAAQKDAILVRTTQDGKRHEIPVDLAAMLRGRHPDIPLEARDLLFVPTSGSKVAARVALESLTRILTWRPF